MPTCLSVILVMNQALVMFISYPVKCISCFPKAFEEKGIEVNSPNKKIDEVKEHHLDKDVLDTT